MLIFYLGHKPTLIINFNKFDIQQHKRYKYKFKLFKNIGPILQLNK